MGQGNTLPGGDESSTISFRVRDALKQQFKARVDEMEDVDSMSEELTNHVRRVVNGTEVEQVTEIEPWEAPEEPRLAKAYRLLCEEQRDGKVPGEQAKSQIAQQSSIPIDQVRRQVLKPLADRGYVKFQSELPPSDYWVVHVRPFSKVVR
jgi:predicted RND superfamily exporter protein